jgi:hypothetical protein
MREFKTAIVPNDVGNVLYTIRCRERIAHPTPHFGGPVSPIAWLEWCGAMRILPRANGKAAALVGALRHDTNTAERGRWKGTGGRKKGVANERNPLIYLILGGL